MSKLLIIAILIVTACQVARPTVPDRTMLITMATELRPYEISRSLLTDRLAMLRERDLLPLLSKEKRAAIQDAADLSYIYYFSCVVALGNGRLQEADLVAVSARGVRGRIYLCAHFLRVPARFICGGSTDASLYIHHLHTPCHHGV